MNLSEKTTWIKNKDMRAKLVRRNFEYNMNWIHQQIDYTLIRNKYTQCMMFRLKLKPDEVIRLSCENNQRFE